jgi:hypothetical protein
MDVYLLYTIATLAMTAAGSGNDAAATSLLDESKASAKGYLQALTFNQFIFMDMHVGI